MSQLNKSAARAAAAAALTVATIAVSAGAADAAPAGDSTTTISGSSYDWRYAPTDVDQAPGPWRHASGTITVNPIDGLRSVEVRGRGTCTTRMRSDGQVMDRGDWCGAWTEVPEGGLGDYVGSVSGR